MWHTHHEVVDLDNMQKHRWISFLKRLFLLRKRLIQHDGSLQFKWPCSFVEVSNVPCWSFLEPHEKCTVGVSMTKATSPKSCQHPQSLQMFTSCESSWWMNMIFAYFRVGQLGQGDTIARPLKQVGPEESCMRKVTKMRKVLMYHWDLGGFI